MLEQWLSKFRKYWLEKDIQSVLSLFAESVEYWETPFVQLHSKDDIRKAWNTIDAHKIEDLSFDISCINASGNAGAIRWKYRRSGTQWSGVYIMHLNEDACCDYFFQCGEEK